MFTGIIEEAGRVVELVKHGEGWRLVVEAQKIHEGLSVGDSVANNGCCLTVVMSKKRFLGFDLLEETLRKTNFKKLEAGSLVNLERSLAANGRFGGHFVSGHIDGVGIITRWEREGADWALEIELEEEMERYVVPKGCIAVDGISLTVGKIEGKRVTIWIIPHTYELTALKDRHVGDEVNLEFDLLAKYVEKILDARR
ncbi:MAG: riboflavin synthase [Verrucomicrobiota bacterium]